MKGNRKRREKETSSLFTSTLDIFFAMIMMIRLLTLLCAPLFFIGVAVATDEAGTKFLEAKSKEQGVLTLPSGLRYKVITKGDGKSHPTENSPCLCHYAGTLIDGTEFDSSYSRGSPTTFAPNQVIKGWTEAMQMMVEGKATSSSSLCAARQHFVLLQYLTSELDNLANKIGDKYELYIPSELAYGERGSPPKIPPNSALVFTIEMIEIKGDKRVALRCNPNTLESCDDKMKAYITKAKTKFGDRDELEEEIARLVKISGNGGLRDDLRDWMQTRLFILQQMAMWSDVQGGDEL
jgi:FKBP-type peptidyl-prolyl cis-trans isomerase FklB